MFSTLANLSVRTVAASCILLLCACAPTETLEFQPRPDMVEVAKQLDCALGRTPTCIERINKPYTCYCADKELLREIMDPDTR